MKQLYLPFLASTFAFYLLLWSSGALSNEFKYNTEELLTLINYSGSLQEEDTSFIVFATKSNVLYRGLDNPVEVKLSGYQKKDMSISIDGGASIRSNENGYIISVPKTVSAKKITITVSVWTTVGIKKLGSTEFKVLNLPPPKVKLCGLYADCSLVTKQTINNNAYLSAELESRYFPIDGIEHTVSSYSFLYMTRNGIQVVKVKGNQLTPKVLEEINKSFPGTRIIFTDIIINGPSGVVDVGSCTIIIK